MVFSPVSCTALYLRFLEGPWRNWQRNCFASSEVRVQIPPVPLWAVGRVGRHLTVNQAHREVHRRFESFAAHLLLDRSTLDQSSAALAPIAIPVSTPGADAVPPMSVVFIRRLTIILQQNCISAKPQRDERAASRPSHRTLRWRFDVTFSTFLSAQKCMEFVS